MKAAGHRLVEHTADVALEIWAPTRTALLNEAAKAVSSIMIGSAEISAAAERTVEVEALDLEEALVVFVNEVIYLATIEGFLLAEADVVFTDAGVTARLRGQVEAGDLLETELKSATYHDLQIEEGPDGLRTTIVIDV